VTSRNLGVSRNFRNLGEIKPDHLVIVHGLNDHMVDQFHMEYPGVAASGPHSTFTYAGRTIRVYGLNFGALEGSYVAESMGSLGGEVN
jgi:hypothetical protein